MPKSPLVTIGLPVTDNVAWVEEAVRSVFAQTETSWELVIVGDGADEDVERRLELIQDDRVRFVRHQERRGLPSRLNEIVELARGRFIARMDGDDVMHPERLRSQLSFLEQASSPIDVLGTGSYLVDDRGEVCGDYREPALPDRISGYLRSGVFSHPTVIMRREWAEANPYDSTQVRTEDKELWMRTASSSRFAKIPERLLFCRVPVALSRSKQALTAQRDRKLIRELGPSIASPGQVRAALVKSKSKEIIFGAMSTTGMVRMAHRRKYLPLGSVELTVARESLALAKSHPVPGWRDEH